MKLCLDHPDLECIYLVMSPKGQSLFKCAQCIIDEDISSTRSLLLMNSILKSDVKTMLLNWPPSNVPQLIQQIVSLKKKCQGDENFVSLKRSISEEIQKVKQEIIAIVDEEEKNIHAMIDRNIQYLAEFEKQYNIFAEKDRFKELLINCNENSNFNQASLADFIQQKLQQIELVTRGLQKSYPQALIDYDNTKLQQTCAHAIEIIKNKIKQIGVTTFSVKSQQHNNHNHCQTKTQELNLAQKECCSVNHYDSISMEGVLSLFDGRNSEPHTESHNNLRLQANQPKHTQTSDQNQINFDRIPNVIFDQQTQIDLVSTLQNDDGLLNSIQSKREDDTKQQQNLIQASVQIEKDEIIQGLSLLKSDKGGAISDLEIGKNDKGLPFVRYCYSGYDHSQCYIDKIFNSDAKYFIRIKIDLKDPLHDQIMIGLIKKEKVNEFYIHQEKICFGNSSFSTVTKIDQGKLISAPEVWPTIKEIELQIHIQSGTFIVTDYPSQQHINSLQTPSFLANQQSQQNQWLLGLFFKSDAEQINNTLTITSFAEI